MYHIIVYWFSPLVGVWSGVKSLEVLRNTFVSFSCLFSFFEPTVTVSASEVLNESAADLPQEDVDLDLPNSLGPKSLVRLRRSIFRLISKFRIFCLGKSAFVRAKAKSLSHL